MAVFSLSVDTSVLICYTTKVPSRSLPFREERTMEESFCLRLEYVGYVGGSIL